MEEITIYKVEAELVAMWLEAERKFQENIPQHIKLTAEWLEREPSPWEA